MTIMTNSRFTAACTALIAAVGFALSATAQQPPAAGAAPPQAAPGQPGPAMGKDMMQRGMERGRMGMDMGQGMGGPGMMDRMMSMMMGADHTEGRLAFIKTELKITEAQTTQWNAFAEAVRANAATMSEMRQTMASHQGRGASLPERLAFEEKAMSAHLEALKKVADSLSKLYGALSPEQKKTADGIVIGPMGMPMGMM